MTWTRHARDQPQPVAVVGEFNANFSGRNRAGAASVRNKK